MDLNQPAGEFSCSGSDTELTVGSSPAMEPKCNLWEITDTSAANNWLFQELLSLFSLFAKPTFAPVHSKFASCPDFAGTLMLIIKEELELYELQANPLKYFGDITQGSKLNTQQWELIMTGFNLSKHVSL